VTGRDTQLAMVTGVPGRMRLTSQRIMLLSRRTHPCDDAVPKVPPTFIRPCSAISPGPPSNT
jgi:hypothetical protein